MTLEMRDRLNYEKGFVCGMIEALREQKYSDDIILTILQKEEGLSRESAEYYIENAARVIQEVNAHRTFMNKLRETIDGLKKSNMEDDMIRLKLQEEFNFDEFDAEFFFDYVENSEYFKR